MTWVGGDVMYGPGAPAVVTDTYMPPNTATTALINDFDTEDGRTSGGGLVTGDPDGGKERSWQVLDIVDAEERGGILRLNAKLARREEARVGIIIPMNPGSVQPMDVSAYDGMKFDLRGDGGTYTVIVSSTDGLFTSTLDANEDWATFEIPFSELKAPSEGTEFNPETVYNIRVLDVGEGTGEPTWFELDNVTFY